MFSSFSMLFVAGLTPYLIWCNARENIHAHIYINYLLQPKSDKPTVYFERVGKPYLAINIANKGIQPTTVTGIRFQESGLKKAPSLLISLLLT